MSETAPPTAQVRHSAPDGSIGGSFNRGSFSSRKTISFHEIAQGGAQQGADMPEVVPTSVLRINRRASKSRASFGLPPGEHVKGFDDVTDDNGGKESMPKLDTVEDVIYALKLATRESIKQLKAGEEKISEDGVAGSAPLKQGRALVTVDMDDGYYSAPSPNQAVTRSDSIKAAQTLMIALNITVEELKKAEIRVISKEPLSPLHSPTHNQEPSSPTCDGIMLRPASSRGFVPKSPSHKARNASFRASHYGSGRIRRGSSEATKGGQRLPPSKRGASESVLGGKRRGTHTGVTKRPAPPKPTGPKRHGSFHQVLHDQGDNRNAVPPGTAMRNHRNSETRRSMSMSLPPSAQSPSAAAKLLSQHSLSSNDLDSPRQPSSDGKMGEEESLRGSTGGKSVVSQVFKDISEPVANLATPKSPQMLTRPMKETRDSPTLSSVQEDETAAAKPNSPPAAQTARASPATPPPATPPPPIQTNTPPLDDDYQEVGTPTPAPQGCCTVQ